MKKSVKTVLCLLLIPYISLCAVVYFAQRDLLYHPDRNQFPPSAYQLDMQEVEYKAKDGTKIESWYWVAPEGVKSRKTIIYFHGNAGHLGTRDADYRMIMQKGYGLLAASYRGFGKSEGEPSEQGLYMDAVAAIEWLKRQGVEEQDMVIYGQSLGTGVAMEMATRYDLNAIILESPYSSMVAAGGYHYPYLPVRFMLKDRYMSLDKVAKVAEPVLIMHGTRDQVVPFIQGEALYNSFVKWRLDEESAVTKMKIFEGQGHNNAPLLQSDAGWHIFLESLSR